MSTPTAAGLPDRPPATANQLYWRILLRALDPTGLDAWATAELDTVAHAADVLIWPRSRPGGPVVPPGMPFRVQAHIVRRGAARITTLMPLPAGVDPTTRVQLALAEADMDAGGVTPVAASQIVQVGLFGQVVFR